MAVKTKEDKTKKIDKGKIVEEVCNELLDLIGVKTKPSVKYDEENDSYFVSLETDEEAGLLIGNRGETINSIQLIIGLVVANKAGEWVRVIVNVGDWREKEEARLEGLAEQAAERAISTGEPQPLYNLRAALRRTLHMCLAKNKDVVTESHGEGDERYLVVLPNSK